MLQIMLSLSEFVVLFPSCSGFSPQVVCLPRGQLVYALLLHYSGHWLSRLQYLYHPLSNCLHYAAGIFQFLLLLHSTSSSKSYYTGRNVWLHIIEKKKRYWLKQNRSLFISHETEGIETQASSSAQLLQSESTAFILIIQAICWNTSHILLFLGSGVRKGA